MALGNILGGAADAYRKTEEMFADVEAKKAETAIRKRQQDIIEEQRSSAKKYGESLAEAYGEKPDVFGQTFMPGATRAGLPADSTNLMTTAAAGNGAPPDVFGLQQPAGAMPGAAPTPTQIIPAGGALAAAKPPTIPVAPMGDAATAPTPAAAPSAPATPPPYLAANAPAGMQPTAGLPTPAAAAKRPMTAADVKFLRARQAALSGNPELIAQSGAMYDEAVNAHVGELASTIAGAGAQGFEAIGKLFSSYNDGNDFSVKPTSDGRYEVSYGAGDAKRTTVVRNPNELASQLVASLQRDPKAIMESYAKNATNDTERMRVEGQNAFNVGHLKVLEAANDIQRSLAEAERYAKFAEGHGKQEEAALWHAQAATLQQKADAVRTYTDSQGKDPLVYGDATVGAARALGSLDPSFLKRNEATGLNENPLENEAKAGQAAALAAFQATPEYAAGQKKQLGGVALVVDPNTGHRGYAVIGSKDESGRPRVFDNFQEARGVSAKVRGAPVPATGTPSAAPATPGAALGNARASVTAAAAAKAKDDADRLAYQQRVQKFVADYANEDVQTLNTIIGSNTATPEEREAAKAVVAKKLPSVQEYGK